MLFSKNDERVQHIEEVEMKNKMEMLDNSTKLLEQAYMILRISLVNHPD